MKDLLDTIKETEEGKTTNEGIVSASRWRKYGNPYKKAADDTPKVVVSNKYDLMKEIRTAMTANGNECSLNHIDVGNIEDFSDLFYDYSLRDFNGDISDWDMKKATNCDRMFCMSQFTGENSDLLGWNMDNVTSAVQMFYKSKFKGDISTWTLPALDMKKSQQFMGGAELAKVRKNWPKKFR